MVHFDESTCLFIYLIFRCSYISFWNVFLGVLWTYLRMLRHSDQGSRSPFSHSSGNLCIRSPFSYASGNSPCIRSPISHSLGKILDQVTFFNSSGNLWIWSPFSYSLPKTCVSGNFSLTIQGTRFSSHLSLTLQVTFASGHLSLTLQVAHVITNHLSLTL